MWTDHNYCREAHSQPGKTHFSSKKKKEAKNSFDFSFFSYLLLVSAVHWLRAENECRSWTFWQRLEPHSHYSLAYKREEAYLKYSSGGCLFVDGESKQLCWFKIRARLSCQTHDLKNVAIKLSLQTSQHPNETLLTVWSLSNVFYVILAAIMCHVLCREGSVFLPCH